MHTRQVYLCFFFLIFFPNWRACYNRIAPFRQLDSGEHPHPPQGLYLKESKNTEIVENGGNAQMSGMEAYI